MLRNTGLGKLVGRWGSGARVPDFLLLVLRCVAVVHHLGDAESPRALASLGPHPGQQRADPPEPHHEAGVRDQPPEDSHAGHRLQSRHSLHQPRRPRLEPVSWLSLSCSELAEKDEAGGMSCTWVPPGAGRSAGGEREGRARATCESRAFASGLGSETGSRDGVTWRGQGSGGLPGTVAPAGIGPELAGPSEAGEPRRPDTTVLSSPALHPTCVPWLQKKATNWEASNNGSLLQFWRPESKLKESGRWAPSGGSEGDCRRPLPGSGGSLPSLAGRHVPRSLPLTTAFLCLTWPSLCVHLCAPNSLFS